MAEAAEVEVVKAPVEAIVEDSVMAAASMAAMTGTDWEAGVLAVLAAPLEW